MDVSVGLVLIFAAAWAAGRLASLLHLPYHLGMLLAGFALRGVLPSSLFTGSPSVAGTLRNFAFVVLLGRSGASLDLKVLRRARVLRTHARMRKRARITSRSCGAAACS